VGSFLFRTNFLVSLKKTIWEPYENFPFHIIISTNFSNILEKYVKFSITKLKFINLKNRKKKKKKKKKKPLVLKFFFLKKKKFGESFQTCGLSKLVTTILHMMLSYSHQNLRLISFVGFYFFLKF
jgi:hypothetical protein